MAHLNLFAKEPIRMIYHKSLSDTLYDDIKNHVENAYKSIGQEVHFINRPVGRGRQEFKAQMVDADLARMSSTYDKKYAAYVPTSLMELTVNKYCFFYFCEKVKSKKEKDLIGVSIRGGEFLKGLDSSLNIVLVDSKIQLIKMIIFGRADYIIAPFGPRGIFSKFLIQIGKPLLKFNTYHWVQNTHKHLIPKLDKFFKENPIKLKNRDHFIKNKGNKSNLLH